MDSEHSMPNLSPEEIFAEAVIRVEAGEPIESVLLSYPVQYHTELRDLLQIIEVATAIQHAPVPMPPMAQRAARRQAFMQAAADLKSEQAESTPLARPAVASGVNAGQPARQAVPVSGLLPQLSNLWSALQAAFSPRMMRLAPLIVVLALVWLSMFSLVSFAQDAIPGDLTYPVKQWMRYQELNLTPPEQRPQILAEIEYELREDIRKAAQQAAARSTGNPDLNQAVVRATSTLIFHSDEGPYFVIGGLQVLKRYQKDANNNQDFYSMAIQGNLTPGSQVVLEYQILPVQGGAFVQGIALRVLESRPIVPTATLAATLTPTNTPLPVTTPTDLPTVAAPCVINAPSGWVPYAIQPGEDLTTIAARTNTTVASLVQVNCLTADGKQSSSVFLAPPVVEPPTAVATVEVTVEATTVATVTASAPITPTVAETPTTDGAVTVTATAEPTATIATDTPTPDVTNTPEATAVPTVTPTVAPEEPTATPIETLLPAPTATPEASATTEPTAEPSATSEGSATTAPVATTTAEATVGDTPLPLETALPLPSATPTTAVATPVPPTALPTVPPTVAPPPTVAAPTATVSAAEPTSEAPAVEGAAVNSTTTAQTIPIPTLTLTVVLSPTQASEHEVRPTFTPTPVNLSPVR